MKRQRHLSLLVVLVLICVCSLLVACEEFPVGVERTFTEPTVSVSTETVLPPTHTVVAVEPTLTPVRTVTALYTATPGASFPTSGKTYTNRDFGVSLRYPDHWQPVKGEIKYAGEDGFFALDAMGNPEATIDQIAADQAGHKLRPYGSQPTVEILDIQGQEARLILPSADASISDQALLIVRYPKPVQLGELCQFLALYADQGHIRAIAGTVRFFEPTVEGAQDGQEAGMSADLVQAREALYAYLHLLHDGHYVEAASYYGGDYGVLWDWNPPVAHDDHATLFENGCKVNGLQCLAIKSIDSEQEISAGEYRFTVEFMADDGGTFVREPSEKRFNYTVKKVDGQFLVQELPVYVP